LLRIGEWHDVRLGSPHCVSVENDLENGTRKFMMMEATMSMIMRFPVSLRDI
jgi:hypothetical protein